MVPWSVVAKQRRGGVCPLGRAPVWAKPVACVRTCVQSIQACMGGMGRCDERDVAARGKEGNSWWAVALRTSDVRRMGLRARGLVAYCAWLASRSCQLVSRRRGGFGKTTWRRAGRKSWGRTLKQRWAEEAMHVGSRSLRLLGLRGLVHWSLVLLEMKVWARACCWDSACFGPDLMGPKNGFKIRMGPGPNQSK